MQRLWTATAAILMAVCLAALATAADSAGTPVGRKVDDFSLPDFHGQMHALSDYPDKVVVVAFLGTECPLAKLYAPRLRDLAAEFAQEGVAFLGIDANLQDSLTEIGALARVSGVTFPLLKDNNNVVADRLGALRTPEVFLIDRQRVVRYWGRVDDQYGFKTAAGYVRHKPDQNDLADSLREVLAGKEVSRPITKADGCLIGRVVQRAPQGDVTYSNQVARILRNHCVRCHRAGEAAPFEMKSYEEVVGWAAMMREVIEQGRMPPWFADPAYGHFANDARLSDEEKKQFFTWVDNGCPEGDEKDLPEPRTYVEGWQMGEPDLVVYMSEPPFDVPAEGALAYQYFVVDPGWTSDRWIQATEPRPGNRAVVHHINVHVEPESVTDAFPREGIGTFGPGFPATICPPGTAFHVPARAKLRFQLHYTPNGSPQQDRSMIGIRFADPRTVKKIVRQPFADSKTFKIPAGDPNYEITSYQTMLKDTLVLSLLPHMHLRGKSFKYEAEYPNGAREVLLDVPRYDFNWQLRYIFEEPKLLPKGATLHCTAHFDNSTENQANPDPTRVVTFGQQTWDEMMEGAFTTVDAGQDVICAALVALSLTAPTTSEGSPRADDKPSTRTGP